MNKKKVIVTGCAGFIGSHLLSELLKQGYHVIGIDNLWTGNTQNIHEALQDAGTDSQSRFEFHESDIRNYSTYAGVDCVYHLAAVASVPGSIEKPLLSHQANVEGFFLMLNRARKNKVRRVVYASSSSVYGDNLSYPQREHLIGEQTSPYAATKRINEIYAQCFSKSYGMECVGLRFFNVFGTRQSIRGSYPAVVAQWASAMASGDPVEIFGDGEQKRDFTYVKDVVQALILSSEADSKLLEISSVINVGCGVPTSLNELFKILQFELQYRKDAVYKPARPGDRAVSCAHLTIAETILGFLPQFTLREGIRHMLRGEPDASRL
jgi:UDP-N-acetylglucosamine 4-epimerase